MVLWQYFQLYLTHEVVLGAVAILDFISWCPSSGTDYIQCEWMIFNCEVLSHDQMVVPCLPFLITWPDSSALYHFWSIQTDQIPWMVEIPTILVIFNFYIKCLKCLMWPPFNFMKQSHSSLLYYNYLLNCSLGCWDILLWDTLVVCFQDLPYGMPFAEFEYLHSLLDWKPMLSLPEFWLCCLLLSILLLYIIQGIEDFYIWHLCFL